MANESMTSKIAQTDSEVQTSRIAMNPKLLEAARSGDEKILDELLRSRAGASVGETAITVREDAPTQEDTGCLLGVTQEGNTVLHIVASRGHLEIAEEICRREISLLATPNKRLDTPLHCAARAGDDKMVSLIIQFAREGEIEKRRVLRAANRDEANALHEAAKYNHASVAKVLMDEDAELASMLNEAGMSPLYLAITTGSLDVAKAMLQSSSWENASRASYAGPNKKTALHAAVLLSRGMSPLYLAAVRMFGSLNIAKALQRSSSWKKASPASYARPNKKTMLYAIVLLSPDYVAEITRALLDRKSSLATDVDSSGRIPLHYAAFSGHHDTVKLLLEPYPSTAYQQDANGSFPIHIAASRGNVPMIYQILKQCPDTDELLDKEGKNFLHVAFQRGKLDVVKEIISEIPDLRKLLNDRDNEGNTPLHTAVKNRDQGSVHFLLRNKTVCVDVLNQDGFTPLDLAYGMLDKDLRFRMNAAEVCIASCLALTKAPTSPRESLDLESGELTSDETKKKREYKDETKKRRKYKDETKEKLSGDDKFKKKSSNDEGNEIGRQVNFARNLGIATVLIATVTFAAGFTVPGGYIADDHPDRGRAVLAKEYAFKVFLVSDASALVCSIVATCWLMYAGTSIVDTHTRKRALLGAINCLWVAFAGMCTAFAMGIYVVLPPSCKRISFLLCIIVLGAPLFAHMVANYNLLSLLKTVRIRKGYRQCIWPTIHLHDKKRLGRALLPPGRRLIILPLLTLCVYAIFFLSAML